MTTWRQLDLLKRDKRGQFKVANPPPLALEFETHCALADTIAIGLTPGWIWTHFPAGELRDKATAGRLKRMGLKPGFFDFLLIDPDGKHYWLELKRGKAPLTGAQYLFGMAMLVRGVPCEVARSYEQAIDILAGWGAIRVKVAA